MESEEHLGKRSEQPLVPSGRTKLGDELRRLRRRHGWSGPQLATALGWSQSKVSRLETGLRSAAVTDVDAWLKALNADEHTSSELLELAEDLLTQMTGLRALHRGSLVRRQIDLQHMDSAAERVRQFQPLMVPGLFHTQEYAEACIDSANLTGELDIDAAVDARLERSRSIVSDASDTDLHVVVCESGLRWRPAGCSSELLPQVWRHLARSLEPENITMQVILDGTPTATLPQCGFSIWDWNTTEGSRLVLVETPAAELTFAGPTDVEMFEHVWQGMLEAALSPQESREWIEQLAYR